MSKKQYTVSRSSTIEAEYRALASLATEIRRTTFICKDLCFPIHHIPQLFCDNKSTIFISKNSVIKQKSKHIETYIHFIRDLISKNHLRVDHVCSENQLADVFTKAVSQNIYISLCRSLKMKFHL